MTRRNFMKTSASLIAGISCVCSQSNQSLKKSSKSPNLLVVFPDQMRAQTLEFMGEDPCITPSLNRFAKQSLVLNQAVSNFPLCSPFRAMFMTGQYPHANGVLGNCNTHAAEHGYELKEDARCWSDILKDNGYELGYIGKWHLDAPHRPYINTSNNTQDFAWNEWTPPHRRHGFDFWYGYGTYDRHTRPMYWTTQASRSEFHYVHQWGPEHEADMAACFLQNKEGRYRDPKKPFVLVVSMNPPHMPYQLVPQKYIDRYNHLSLEQLCRRPNIPPSGTKWGDYYRKHIKNYLAMVTGVDEQFGRILDVLKTEGLENNTLVLFMSDHGNCLGIHDQISKNNHYEESMRVPFLLRWPGHIKPRCEDLLLSSPDIFPTLLDLMGFHNQIPSYVQGKSHSRLFLENKGTRPSSQLYLHIPYGHPGLGRRGVRTLTHTLMVSRMPDQNQRIVLHDNQKDPYQLKNIAKEKSSLVNKLVHKELIPWLKRTRDPWVKSWNL
ncbi:MAG: sulfatase-like hydrolase/transferase [Candidatus Aminicenantes bacterium]|nr:sulfatase-like hydrolase/transferase [Candidatus Aminicenantes bacterium]